MQALVLDAFGKPLVLREVPNPTIKPNEVLVQVGACGVGLTVVNLLETVGRVKRYPLIPGHEIAGTIIEVGSLVKSVKPGDRVTNHFYLTCGQCRYCRSGQETLCSSNLGNIGQACDGGYAQYVSLPERNVIAIPDGVSDVDAAVASDAIATPYHACVKEAKIKPGDAVMVIGAAGGVGIHMIQMARLCGAKVIAVDVGADKLNFIKEALGSQGPDYLIDAALASISQQILELTHGKGVEAVIDVVASKNTLEQAVASLAVRGRLVIIGNHPQSVYKENPSFLVHPGEFLARGLEIHASRYVTLSEIERTLELVRDGRIKSIVTEVVPLKGIPELHQKIRHGKTLGRVAMSMGL
jgi:propanol-preferring alcohol dehydrogenase